MIKTVFFDLDGVLTLDSDGLRKISENICSERPDLELENVYRCYFKHSIPLLKSGRPHADIWGDFCVCVGSKIDIAALHGALRTVRKNEALFAIVNSLKQKCTIGIITDNFTERMDLLKIDLDLLSLFDPIIVSAEVGASKHDGTTKIYDMALEKAKCRPEEALFIDNTQQNLVVPLSMGMQTYWHDDQKNDTDTLLTMLNMLVPNKLP